MKTILLLLSILLLGLAQPSVQAQDFQAVQPAQQPNAAELAYFGNKHPNAPLNSSVSDNIQLVGDFLNDLISGQFEAAHRRLARGFVAYGPGYNDKLETDNLLDQWDYDGNRFADQHLTIVHTSVTTIADGDNKGTWVYLNVIWLATERSGQGRPFRIPFHQVALVNNGLVERTYTSYGNDQIFYDLGFPLYTDGPTHRRNELTQKR